MGGTAWELGKAGYHVTVVDINEAQISIAQSAGLSAYQGDVRVFGNENVWLPLPYLEFYEAVIMEALLCNVIGHDANHIMGVADMYLRPGGKVFIADMLRNDESERQTIMQLAGEKIADNVIMRWNDRYRYNCEAGLPDGTFIVMPDGETKHMEWKDPSALREIIESKLFLRFARHYRTSELLGMILDQGFDIPFFGYTLWNSSAGPILGCQIVAEKGPGYTFQPWYKGLTPKQRGDESLQQWRRTMQHRYPSGYDIEFWRRLRTNIPEGQRMAFEALYQFVNK